MGKDFLSWLKNLSLGFLKFWYDFLIGDTPEFFVLTIGIVLLVVMVKTSSLFIIPAVLVASLGVLWLSLYHARIKQ